MRLGSYHKCLKCIFGPTSKLIQGGTGGNGSEAGREVEEVSVDQPEASTSQPKCFLVIHSVSKRHNVGNLLRSATAFGVHEVRSSPPLPNKSIVHCRDTAVLSAVLRHKRSSSYPSQEVKCRFALSAPSNSIHLGAREHATM